MTIDVQTYEKVSKKTRPATLPEEQEEPFPQANEKFDSDNMGVQVRKHIQGLPGVHFAYVAIAVKVNHLENQRQKPGLEEPRKMNHLHAQSSLHEERKHSNDVDRLVVVRYVHGNLDEQRSERNATLVTPVGKNGEQGDYSEYDCARYKESRVSKKPSKRTSVEGRISYTNIS